MSFKDFKKAVQERFKKMESGTLFATDVSGDDLWTKYLMSFPDGSNPIFKERTEHDCSCCRQFIKTCGNVVFIRPDNKLASIWDIAIGEHYQVVADAMSKLVKSKLVKDVFYHYEKNLGTDKNRQELEDGNTLIWEHFHHTLTGKHVLNKASIGPTLSDKRSIKEVFQRSLEEISLDAIETTLELIDQNSLYRGEENKSVIIMILKIKNEYDKIKNVRDKNNYCWSKSLEIGAVSKIRNTAIGTLLTDLSEGKDLNEAVRMFEAKVAPINYKRPTALITKGMITSAQKKVEDLDIEPSLHRRYAILEDITINNILFADRESKKEMNVFDEMAVSASTKKKDMNLEKVEEVDISTFITGILPHVDTVELMLENKHNNNLMSLIAPIYPESKNILKWGNNFSWSYNGEVADSIKERVKNAGGNVDGILRCSLSWFNYDDLDIHVVEPDRTEIFFSNYRKPHSARSTGQLDVDMNVQSNESRNAVENIVWTNENRMQEGKYRLFVHNYTPRETIDIGFDAEIEYKGKIHSFHYSQRVQNTVDVAFFNFTREKGIEIIDSLPTAHASKEIWGINTNNFHRVKMIMNSPNHWDGEKTGNKHYFFILENCINPDKARGFYNEFLNEDLREHRKVFEVLGSKMKAVESDRQLSGLGFSSTQKNQIICKVKGNFTRTIKINF